MADELASQLEAALQPEHGKLSVEALRRLSGGASRETWAFDAVDAGQRHELILRRDPPERPSAPGAMTLEARVIRAAASAGLAVPHVLAAADDVDRWGSAGVVMGRVEGETLARRILRDDSYAAARGRLVAQLGEFLAGLHAIDADIDGLAEADSLASVKSMFVEFGEPSPTFSLAIDFLETHPAPRRGPTIVHGDFRLGNVVVGPDGLRAVLDWELVHAGNPVEDLGWLCAKAWRYGVDRPVAGLGSREELLAAYRRAGGADIDLDELRWWEVLGTLRWGAICQWQADAHLSGAMRSVELAAIGRRVCEQEWDLLLLLVPDAAEAAAATRPRLTGVPEKAGPHGRPTAGELLDAVREFLTDWVVTQPDAQLSFHARVAANALAIVERELELGPIEPPSDPTDVAAVARHVAAKLSVANSKYFEARG